MGKYFKTGNTKLGKDVRTLSCTPAGINCPGSTHEEGGCRFKTKTGSRGCYALRLGKLRPSLRQYWAKVDHLFSWADKWGITSVLNVELKRMNKRPRAIRLFGSGGDFKDQTMVNTLTSLAMLNPDIRFYAYTKSLHLDFTGLPDNFKVVQSVGGKYDHLIDWSKPHARVFANQDELIEAGYVDGSDDDTLAESGEVVRIGLIAH